MWLSIQYLRAVAALLVVTHHALDQAKAAGPSTQFLQAGVDVFFAISGFIIWRTAMRSPRPPLQFLWRRLVRIAPLYWVLTTLVLVVAVCLPGLLQSTRLEHGNVIASYLFVAWPSPSQAGAMRPLMAPGWTLNYEMFFYGLFALTLCAPQRFRAACLLAALAALVAAGLFVVSDPGGLRVFYTSPLLLEFALGVLAAIVIDRVRPSSPFVAGCCLALALAVLFSSRWREGDDAARLLRAGLPAAAIVFCVAQLETHGLVRWWRPGLLLGDASYAIYLAHPLVLSAFAQGWRAAGFEHLPLAVFLILGVAMATAGGLVAHLALERPLADLASRVGRIRPGQGLRLLLSAPPKESIR